MTLPPITGVHLSEPGAGPLLVLGPSLGTSSTALWSLVGARLADRYHLVAWDLPGHGRNRAVGEPFSFAELAAGVCQLIDGVLAQRTEAGGSFDYAGDSVGGAVGLQLLLDQPDRVRAATLICTGAKLGEPAAWRERAQKVRLSGTAVMISASAERWFADGFLSRHPEVATGLLHSLQDADREGYAQVCDALADFDVRHRLGEITAPVLAVAGKEDIETPPAMLEEIAGGVRNGRLVVLDQVAHLAVAEEPDITARLIHEHLSGGPAPEETGEEIGRVRATYDAGAAVRRAVLGDAEVDGTDDAVTDFTRDFQEMITRTVWGTIWTRPGLDRRSRSMIALTALIARGHHEELALHVRAAVRNGLTREEIKEVLLQSAVYCGVPDADTAFRIAQGVLAEFDP